MREGSHCTLLQGGTQLSQLRLLKGLFLEVFSSRVVLFEGRILCPAALSTCFRAGAAVLALEPQCVSGRAS